MESKKFSRKLKLNKKTIVNLNNGEMEDVHGGIGLTERWSNCILCTVTCGSCPTNCGSCDTNQTGGGGACCCAPG